MKNGFHSGPTNLRILQKVPGKDFIGAIFLAKKLVNIYTHTLHTLTHDVNTSR